MMKTVLATVAVVGLLAFQAQAEPIRLQDAQMDTVTAGGLTTVLVLPPNHSNPLKVIDNEGVAYNDTVVCGGCGGQGGGSGFSWVTTPSGTTITENNGVVQHFTFVDDPTF